MESILTSIKKSLGIVEEYTHFDADIIMHVNSVFSILTQLGVGPEDGYFIKDKSAKWEDFMPMDDRLEFVKSYVFMKVKLLFDPSASSVVVGAMDKAISELEWRIQVAVDQ